MRNLYKVLEDHLRSMQEGILDKDFDFDVPKEIEMIVKAFKRLKFQEELMKGVIINYINSPGYEDKAIKVFMRISKLFRKLPAIRFADHINDSSAMLIGVSDTKIVIGVPGTDNAMQLFLRDFVWGDPHKYKNVCIKVSDNDASGRMMYVNTTAKFNWYTFPAEYYNMIKSAIFK